MYRQTSTQITNRTVDLSTMKVKVLDKVGEGAYADVFRVQRVSDNKFFAMKKLRLVKDNHDASINFKNEKSTLKKLGMHENIVQLIEMVENKAFQGQPGDREVFLLYELCPSGNLFNLIQHKSNQGLKGIPEGEVLDIVSDIIKGLLHMHMQDPSIAHRDIKLENILRGADNKWKICDFGSSTTNQHDHINQDNRYLIQEEIEKSTTPLYRAPEQLDLYSGYPITNKVDIFALGCIIYTLLFFRSPFDPNLPLDQSNARYRIPDWASISPSMTSLLAKTLTPDPRERISSEELWSVIDSNLRRTDSSGGPVGMEQKNRPRTPRQDLAPPLQNYMDQPISRQNVPQNRRDSQRSASQAHRAPQQQIHRQAQSQSQLGARVSNHFQYPVAQPQGHPQTPQYRQQKFSDGLMDLNVQNKSQQVQSQIMSYVCEYCETSDQAPSELTFRHLVVILHSNPSSEHITYFRAISSLDKLLVTVALKVLIMTHRAMLYCSFINPAPFEKLYQKMSDTWKDINENQLGNSADMWRNPFFTRLVYQYSEILLEKVKVVNEFNNIIDSAYVLQSGTVGPRRTKNANPLDQQFLGSLTKLWQKFNTIQGSLFVERRYLFDIRLALALNLIEDQYLLLSLLVHLNFTYKMIYKAYQDTSTQEQLSQIQSMIQQFDQAFNICLKNYQDFLGQVFNINDLRHLQSILPQVRSDLLSGINDSVQKENKVNVVEECLQISAVCQDYYLPVRYKIYPNYEKSCNRNFEIVLGNIKYRVALGKTLPTDYFQNFQADPIPVQKQPHLPVKAQSQSIDQFMLPSVSNEKFSLQPKNANSGSKQAQSFIEQLKSNRGKPIIKPPSIPLQKVQNRIKVIKNIKPPSGSQKKTSDPLLSEDAYNDILNNVLHIRAIEPAPVHNSAEKDGPQQVDLLELDAPSETQQLNEVFNNQGLIQEEKKDQQFEEQKTPRRRPNDEVQQLFSDSKDMPAEMYTTGSVYQYKTIANASLIQQLANIPGINDCQDELETPKVILDELNQFDQPDMEGVFALELEQITDKQQMEAKAAAHDLDYERMIQEQQLEEQRQMMKIEYMKEKEKSEDEIKLRQTELESLQAKFKNDQTFMQNQRSMLEDQVNRFNAEKARFLQQQAINKQNMQKEHEEFKKLKEANEQLKQQNQNLVAQQRQNSNKTLLQQQRSVSTLNTHSSALTDTEIADEILETEFGKSQSHFRIKVEDILLENQIGAGASADVWKATYKENDVAVKKLRFPASGVTGGNNMTKEFQREIATLIKVRHTNLVNFMGACAENNKIGGGTGSVLILTEFCFGGSLFSLLHEKRSVNLTFKQRYRMALDIAKGMNFLHIQEPPILHRDLKSLNLLLTEEVKSDTDHVQVKITDFGLSRSKFDSDSNLLAGNGQQMTGCAGTFHWMAPEILQSQSSYTYKADVYSYGIVLWEIICREPPFKSLRPHEIMARVLHQGARPDMSHIPPECPNELVVIMQKCWDTVPEKRPDFNIIIKALRSIENKVI